MSAEVTLKAFWRASSRSSPLSLSIEIKRSLIDGFDARTLRTEDEVAKRDMCGNAKPRGGSRVAYQWPRTGAVAVILGRRV